MPVVAHDALPRSGALRELHFYVQRTNDAASNAEAIQVGVYVDVS